MAVPNIYAVNPQPFAGKVITITGASRGVGLVLSKYLLARGATVSGCATSQDNLANAAKEIGEEFPEAKNRYWTRVADIRDLDAVRSWIEETVTKFGKPDGCANVAALEQRELFPITDLDPEYFTNLLNLNVVGTFHCLKEEMKVIKDSGAIVNVGSVTSNYATAGVSAYVAAKHAIIGLTKVAAYEGAVRGIRVNALCPGAINSKALWGPFTTATGEFRLTKDNIPTLLRYTAEPVEIAASIAFLLGEESKYVTKAAWYQDGGWLEGNYSS